MLVALPWIAFAIAITVAGGIVFAVAMIAIGVVCLREYVAMTEDSRPLAIPAYLAVAALIVAAHFGTAFNVLLVLAASFPLLFAFAARRTPPRRGHGLDRRSPCWGSSGSGSRWSTRCCCATCPTTAPAC